MLILSQSGTSLVSFKDISLRKKYFDMEGRTLYLPICKKIPDGCDVECYVLVFYELSGGSYRVIELAAYSTAEEAMSMLRKAGQQLAATGLVDFSASNGE